MRCRLPINSRLVLVNQVFQDSGGLNARRDVGKGEILENRDQNLRRQTKEHGDQEDMRISLCHRLNIELKSTHTPNSETQVIPVYWPPARHRLSPS